MKKLLILILALSGLPVDGPVAQTTIRPLHSPYGQEIYGVTPPRPRQAPIAVPDSRNTLMPLAPAERARSGGVRD